jgi:hypothetical protein
VLGALLSSPFAAVALGIAAGSIMALLNSALMGRMGANDPFMGVAWGLGGYFAGLIVGMGLILGYRAIARGGFVYFGVALALSFLVVTVLAQRGRLAGTMNRRPTQDAG